MIIFENKFINMEISDRDVLVIKIISNECIDNEYISESIDSMIEAIRNTYYSYQKLQKKLCLLFNATELNQILPISCVWRVAQFFSSTKHLTEEVIIGSSIVTSSNIIITLVNTFSTFYKNVKPMKFTKELDEGLKFLYDLKNQDNDSNAEATDELNSVSDIQLTKDDVDKVINDYNIENKSN